MYALYDEMIEQWRHTLQYDASYIDIHLQKDCSNAAVEVQAHCLFNLL